MANTSPRHMPVIGNVHPIKIEKIFFRDIISLFSRIFIFLIDRATQEVPMKNYFEIYTIALLVSTSTNEA